MLLRDNCVMMYYATLIYHLILIFLFAFMLDQEIEPDQFNNLIEEDLKILIPNIGPRRKFQNFVKKYQDVTEVFIHIYFSLCFLVK